MENNSIDLSFPTVDRTVFFIVISFFSQAQSSLEVYQRFL